jgi:UDP-N-acetylglucosamine diphosphorylase/glucosamine-1-phosphate N-acetyltransferase
MNSIVLNDNSSKNSLYPLTLTRCVIDIRMGILTLREKWRVMGFEPIIHEENGALPAHIIPAIQMKGDLENHNLESILYSAKKVENPVDIFKLNDELIKQDYLLVTDGRESRPVSPTNKTIFGHHIFIEAGAVVEHCILNAATGPIYIGKNAEIMEGSNIRGPFALCENSVVKMGTKIYGATTVGKNCVVGGEIKNSVISDYTNKAHDGYLGDSVIGQWCNIGAGSCNSNIKNTAGTVSVWNGFLNQPIYAGIKCGLIMGDYSRCSINTSFNTGTVVGVCCNIFGSGLTPKHLASFTWGYGESIYEFKKAMQNLDDWKKLKNESLADDEIQTLKHIFEQSKALKE